MSHIPNSAMKHANADAEPQMNAGEESGARRRFTQMQQQMQEGATRVADKARAHPGAALAVGGAILGSIAAAAAVPLYRRSRDGEDKAANKTAKAPAGKSAASKSAKSAKPAKSGNSRARAKAGGAKSQAKTTH